MSDLVAGITSTAYNRTGRQIVMDLGLYQVHSNLSNFLGKACR